MASTTGIVVQAATGGVQRGWIGWSAASDPGSSSDVRLGLTREPPLMEEAMSEDKIIQFPGADESGSDHDTPVSGEGSGATGIPGMSADQEKAIQIAVDGMSFVMVGIKPTDNGADFFTAIHGKRGELADAAPHLDGVIQRALSRMGVTS